MSNQQEQQATSLPTGWRLAMQLAGFAIGAAFLAWLINDAVRGEKREE